VVSVGGKNCESASLDEVMEAVGDAASPVKLVFRTEYCLLKVIDGDESSFVTAREGDNLRVALLDAGKKVYDFRGMMTNCNGGGQCATCVVDVADLAFGPQSDWEASKLKGRPPTHRLSCQTLVSGAGAATVTLRATK